MDGATLLGKEQAVSGRGSRNAGPGTKGILLESMSRESTHVPIAQRPCAMWAGWLKQLQTHPSGLSDSFSLYLAVTACKSKTWGKTCRQEDIRRSHTESGEPFCTADVCLTSFP